MMKMPKIFLKSVMARAFLALSVAVSAAFGSALVAASATYVGSVTYSVSPLHPEPNTPFTLTATFHGAGHGQPCDISNIRATIQGVQGVTVNGRPVLAIRIHPATPA